MDRDEIINLICLLDHDQLVMLKLFLCQLTCHAEKQKEQEGPDLEGTELKQ